MDVMASWLSTGCEFKSHIIFFISVFFVIQLIELSEFSNAKHEKNEIQLSIFEDLILAWHHPLRFKGQGISQMSAGDIYSTKENEKPPPK